MRALGDIDYNGSMLLVKRTRLYVGLNSSINLKTCKSQLFWFGSNQYV